MPLRAPRRPQLITFLGVSKSPLRKIARGLQHLQCLEKCYNPGWVHIYLRILMRGPERATGSSLCCLSSSLKFLRLNRALGFWSHLHTRRPSAPAPFPALLTSCTSVVLTRGSRRYGMGLVRGPVPPRLPTLPDPTERCSPNHFSMCLRGDGWVFTFILQLPILGNASLKASD